MTRNESATIDKLRDELHAYHVDVQKLVQRCEACRAAVVQVTTDIYGLPGNHDGDEKNETQEYIARWLQRVGSCGIFSSSFTPGERLTFRSDYSM